MFAGVASGGEADVWVSPEAEHGDEFGEFDEAYGDEQACGDQRCEAIGGVAMVIAAPEEAEFHVFAQHDVE